MKHQTSLKIHAKEKHFWWDVFLVFLLWVAVFFVPQFHSLVRVVAIVASLELLAFFSFHLLKKDQSVIMQGFLGGMISSTTVFVRLTSMPARAGNYSLGLVSATLAMLIECLLILINFIKSDQYYLGIPILVQVVFLSIYLFYLNRTKATHTAEDLAEVDHPVLWINVFKLAAMVLLFIYGLRFLNNYFHLGSNLAIFIMSFFEAHSVLAASLLSQQQDSDILLQVLLILSGHTISKSLLIIRSKQFKQLKNVIVALIICLALSWGSFLALL